MYRIKPIAISNSIAIAIAIAISNSIAIYNSITIAITILAPVTVDVSPDDQLLLTGSFDTTTAILDCRYGDVLERYEAHTGKVVKVQWHPTQARFVSCSADRSVLVWSAEPH